MQSAKGLEQRHVEWPAKENSVCLSGWLLGMPGGSPTGAGEGTHGSAGLLHAHPPPCAETLSAHPGSKLGFQAPPMLADLLAQDCSSPPPTRPPVASRFLLCHSGLLQLTGPQHPPTHPLNHTFAYFWGPPPKASQSPSARSLPSLPPSFSSSRPQLPAPLSSVGCSRTFTAPLSFSVLAMHPLFRPGPQTLSLAVLAMHPLFLPGPPSLSLAIRQCTPFFFQASPNFPSQS